jgi:uncharacterized protein (DUF1499 family)
MTLFVRLMLSMLALMAAAFALAVLAGRLGWLSGKPPLDLGVRDGRLAPPSITPNSVSSQADLWPDNPQHVAAKIAPLALSGDAVATMTRLRAIVESMPGARIMTARDDYLYVGFTTRWLRFTDDAEFWLDRAHGVVQVRSASRLGRGDLGVNRVRIEAIRARLAGP